MARIPYKVTDPAAPARAQITTVLVAVLIGVPVALNVFGQSRCGRIKEALMWLGAGLVGLLLARLWAVRPAHVPLPRHLARPALAWLAVVALTTVTAWDRPASLWAAISLLPGVVLAAGVAVSARRTAARGRLIQAWVISAACVSAFAFLEYYWLGTYFWHRAFITRASGTIGAPIYLGAYLAMALPFAVALFQERKAPRWLGPATAAMVAALVITYSRGSWVAAIAGVMAMIYAASRRPDRSVPYPVVGALAVLIAVVPFLYRQRPAYALPCAALIGIVLVWRAWQVAEFRPALRWLGVGLLIGLALFGIDSVRPGSPAVERVATAADPDNEALSARAEFRAMATTLMLRRPWLGWGPDGYTGGLSIFSADGLARPIMLLYPHQNPHSEWYTAAVDGGVIGLLAWGFFVLALASAAIDRSRAEQGLGRDAAANGLPVGPAQRRRALVASAAFGSVVAFFVQGCVTPRGPVTTLGLALVWGLVAALEPRQTERHRWVAAWERLALRGASVVWAAAAAVICLSILMADLQAGRGRAMEGEWRLAEAVWHDRAAAAWCPMEPGYRRLWGETALKWADAVQGPERFEAAGSAYSAFNGLALREPGVGAWCAGRALALCTLNPEAALPDGIHATQKSPQSSYAWWSLARACRVNNAPEDEKDALRRSIEAGALDPAPYLRLAEVFRTEKRPDLSDSVMAMAAERFPKDFPARHQAARGF